MIKNEFFYFSGDKTDFTENWVDVLPPLGIRAPCASTEDLTLYDDLDDAGGAKKGSRDDDDATPTPSLSLGSSPSLNCGSLASTPVQHPIQDIGLCFQQASAAAEHS